MVTGIKPAAIRCSSLKAKWAEKLEDWLSGHDDKVGRVYQTYSSQSREDISNKWEIFLSFPLKIFRFVWDYKIQLLVVLKANKIGFLIL